MLNFLVPAADILPEILSGLGLPEADYVETADEETGKSICTASVYCSNEGGVPSGLRSFTATSSDGPVVAKHLSALYATRHLKTVINLIFKDYSYYELTRLKLLLPPDYKPPPAEETSELRPHPEEELTGFIVLPRDCFSVNFNYPKQADDDRVPSSD